MDLRRSLVEKRLSSRQSKQSSKAASRNHSNFGTDDEFEDDDNLSVLSIDSTDSVLDGSQDVDEEQIFEQVLDNLTERKGSSLSSREQNLAKLIRFMAARAAMTTLASRSNEVSSLLPKILRSARSPKETLLCIRAMTLHYIADPDDDTIYELYKPALLKIVNDLDSSDLKAAALCSLGMMTLVLQDAMEAKTWLDLNLEIVENNGCSIGAEDDSGVMSSAIDMMALALTSLRGEDEEDLKLVASCLIEQLRSADTRIRTAAGEALALCFELSFHAHADDEATPALLDHSEMQQVIKLLSDLATASSKRQSKSSKREQHATFREILATVSSPSSHSAPSETVKFGTHRQALYVTTWSQACRLAQFRHILGSGLVIHLQRSALVRRLLDIEGPIVDDDDDDVKAEDVSKDMRNSINSELRKQRHKERADERKEKSAMHTSFIANDED